MSEEEVIKYLVKKAPRIMWAIEDGKIERGSYKYNGKIIRGMFMLDGEMLSDTMPMTYDRDLLGDIAEGFKTDYEKKTNAIS